MEGPTPRQALHLGQNRGSKLKLKLNQAIFAKPPLGGGAQGVHIPAGAEVETIRDQEDLMTLIEWRGAEYVVETGLLETFGEQESI